MNRVFKIKQIGPKEWHVLEYSNYPEPYILARCTGPVPAGEIYAAMRLLDSFKEVASKLRGTCQLVKGEADKFEQDLEFVYSKPENIERL